MRATYGIERFSKIVLLDDIGGNLRVTATKYFSDRNVAYSPEVIEIMSLALEASIESLPEPVSATQVQTLAESILDTAGRGERDVGVLERIALVELQIAPRA